VIAPIFTTEGAISVVLPVYNGREYLEEAISSVLQQTHGQFELIISDDGSMDGSLEIIRGFSDPRIRVLDSGRRGLFDNLNRLVREARYPLVHIFCQDDVMTPDCLEEQARFMTLHPDIGMAFSKCLVIDGQGRALSVGELGDLPEVMSASLALQCLFYHGCMPGNLSTVCVRRSCFDAVGLFDGSFGVSADYEMWVRISQRWDMGVCHKHLLNIRAHDKQLSHARSSGLAFISQNQRIRTQLLPLLPKEIQDSARSYERKRQRVLAVHFGMRCLAEGNPSVLLGIAKVFGAREFFAALLFWLLTLNNHLYEPSCQFAIPERDRANMKVLAERQLPPPLGTDRFV
jgi:glycosyltransferase involved in cell wall biosynthesis